MTLPSSDITTTPDPDTAPLRQYALTDNLAADSGAVFLTGTQALVRLLLMQRRRDQAAGPEHRRLRLRLPRQPAGHGRPAVVEGQEVPGRVAGRVPAGDQRGPGRDGLPGHAARRARPEAHRRGRDGHVVRQGPRRRPLGRRAEARQRLRLQPAGRRAGRGRRRPRLRVVVDAAPERPRHASLEHAGAAPGQRRRVPGVRPLRLGAVALLGRVGRLQGDLRGRRVGHDRRPRRRAAGLHATRGLHAHAGPARALGRPAIAGARVAPGREDRRGARVRQGQLGGQAHRREPQRHAGHRHGRQGALRLPRGAAPPRARPERAGRGGRAHLQGGPGVPAGADAHGGVRARPRGDPRDRGEGAGRRAPDQGTAVRPARPAAPAHRRQDDARRRAAAVVAGRAAAVAHHGSGGRLARAPEPRAGPHAPGHRLHDALPAAQRGRRHQAPALLLLGLPAQHVHEGARGLARAGRHRLPLHGELDGARDERPDPDGRRRRRLGGALALHEGKARLPESRRRHVLPLGVSGDPPGDRRQGHDHLQDPLQRRGRDDRRPAGRRLAVGARDRAPGGGRGREARGDRVATTSRRTASTRTCSRPAPPSIRARSSTRCSASCARSTASRS